MKITRRRLCAVGLPLAAGGAGCLGGSGGSPDDGSSGDDPTGSDSGGGDDTSGADDADAVSDDGTATGATDGDDAGDGDSDGNEGSDGDDEIEAENDASTDESTDPHGNWNRDWEWDGALPVDAAVQHHDPSCGCCSNYAAYLEDHGLDVRLEETGDIRGVKEEFDVPRDARSCHTVEIDGYLVEGHVPLEAVATLLAERPDVDGIAAPGMPRNSPGMGGRGDEPLTIYAFESAGEVTEYEDV